MKFGSTIKPVEISHFQKKNWFLREHSAILLTFIKLPFVTKIFVLYIFEWLFYTGFTVIVAHMFSLARAFAPYLRKV